MKEEGADMEETARWTEEHKKNIVHLFTVDDLNHLYRGGRVSRTTAVLGGMLNIKPVLHVDDEGKLIPIGKVRGRKKSILELVSLMEKRSEATVLPATLFLSATATVRRKQSFLRQK